MPLKKCQRSQLVHQSGTGKLRFGELIIGTVKKTIPRGFRKSYVPGWNVKRTEFYKRYTKIDDMNVANDLIKELDMAQKLHTLEQEAWISLNMGSTQTGNNSMTEWHCYLRV